MDYRFSKISSSIKKSEIRELLSLTRKPGIISFGGGLPDSKLFPTKEITEITEKVLHTKGYLALQYGPTHGEADMISSLIKFMSDFGEKAEHDEICVTSSSQQGLDLVSRLFIDESTPVIMELPSYLGAIQAFRRDMANMIGVKMDFGGMDIGMLEREIEKLEKKKTPPAFIYTIPDFQNPSGITMTLDRRNELVQFAANRGILIIEDSPYRELSFTGEILPSLWTISGGKGVVLLKTFSKMLFPGMRMGWITAEKEIIDKIIMLKQSVDLCTPSFTQLILSEFISRGNMEETIKKAIELYKPKISMMLSELQKNMPEEVVWSKPGGGMFLWLILPEHIDAKEVFYKAIEKNVAYVTGQPFHCDGSGKNTMRLNYSFPSLEGIEKGIKILSEVIKEFICKK
ncbi:PLP-dependent aminotransferase family protein [candidate division WOR-3 bacterium]|nr:PLP-dependent aminotransferase family protein [candidate division WOR-3 bacterium]